MRNGSLLAAPALVAALLACCALLLPVAAAWSQQEAAPAPQNRPNFEKAWDLQANTVAQELGLSPELTTKLVDAYKAARKTHQEALMTQFGQGAPRPTRAAMQKFSDEHRASLEAALKGFLTPEQTTKALESLGTFSLRLDQRVMALDSLKLDDATMAKAMAVVTKNVAEADKASRAASENESDETRNANRIKMREKMDTELGAILSAEQMTQWKQATTMRGGQRGGGGARGEGGREGGPAPAPAPAPAAPAPAK